MLTEADVETLSADEITTERVSRRGSLGRIGSMVLGAAFISARATGAAAQTTDTDSGQHADHVGAGSDSDTGPGADPPGHGHRVRREGCTDHDTGQWADAPGFGSRCK